MGQSINIYSGLKTSDIELLLENFKIQFDQNLKDLFSEEELKQYEEKIESIAAIYIQPIPPELVFEDFYFNLNSKDRLSDFFAKCQSMIIFDNLPFFDSNIFQVTYLNDFVELFDELLIDRGGVSELIFKEDFLKELRRYSGIEKIIPLVKREIVCRDEKKNIPVDPIDFLILDVYKELDRLNGVKLDLDDLPQKTIQLIEVMKNEKLNSSDLFIKSKMNPKEFDDNLEKIKFRLKKITR